ncbi:MAG: TraB/GumN family protein [Gammaproteobacteria bacterium]
MKPFRTRRVIALLLLTAVSVLATPASAEGPSIWEYQGATGTVLLLGSVHVLRQQDYPLPAAVEAAYAAADTLVMEIDTSSLDPLSAQMLITGMGSLEPGRSMSSVMGQKDFDRASRLASEMGFDLALMQQFEPWFAALTIMNLQMMRMGFNPQIGLESHLSGQAARDGKPIVGLETMEFQLQLFDAMPERVQSDLLLQTLEEAGTMEKEMDAMIRAWRAGDAAALARIMGENFAEYPDVYEALVTRRNRNWAGQIVEMADRPGTHLVVVGALHLVGKDSLIRMLEQKGRRVNRWRAAD